jgi:hypothetical protein
MRVEEGVSCQLSVVGFAQKVFLGFRLCRTLAVSLRLTVSQLEYQALPKLSHVFEA